MSLKKVGALWKKQDKNTGEFLSGMLDLGILGQARLMVFPNRFKKAENQPDATIQLVIGQKDDETPF